MAIPTTFPAFEPDLLPDRAVGILLPFNGNAQLLDRRYGEYNRTPVKDVKPFQLSYSTEDQAVTNLVNLLLTRKGERPMQPTFGSLIPDFIFEQNTPSNREILRDSLEDDIMFWLPYLNLRSVSVLAQDDIAIGQYDSDHNAVIKIEFSVGNTGANRTVTVFNSGDLINIEVA
jgi:phage baseplate assembly protein W